MPFNIGPGELLLILAIALLVIGPGRLPEVGASLGRSLREFRKASTEMQDAVTSATSAASGKPAAATASAAAPAASAAPSQPAPAAPVSQETLPTAQTPPVEADAESTSGA